MQGRGGFPRASGVLLHPTSLPGPYGIGDLGSAARRFVDYLADARQSLWQVLPLGPTGFGDSPYQSFSAFAGNPLLLAPDDLVTDGFLAHDEIASFPVLPADRVDFARVIPLKSALLRRAADHLHAEPPVGLSSAFADFCERSRSWLEDHALFMALKEEHGGAPWTEWSPELRRREQPAMTRARARLATAIARHRLVQFAFFRQWEALRTHAARRRVRLVGDIPIFVAHDSSDVWAHPELFELDADGQPTVVAGVPPDYFSRTGQLWGNPLYRWDAAASEGFRWWIARIRATLELFDIVRIDHFIGFVRYWEVPAAEVTAVHGRWCPGPGGALFEALRAALGRDLPIIAEDLGATGPEVEALRDRFDFPGMKVLQFAFDDGPDNLFLPHHYGERCVAYTGTHDNDTSVGWFQDAPPAQRAFAQRYLARSGEDIAYDLIRAAQSSVAATAIAPMQDVLSLGSQARMNTPGRASGNWTWRLAPDALDPGLGERLAEMTELYGRAPRERDARD